MSAIEQHAELLIDHSPQGSDEWLQARAGVVTSSRFADVMAGGKGITRQKYMHKLANERLTGRYISDGFKSHYMERGNETEDQARAAYELRTGHDVTEVGLVYLDEWKRIGASVDSLASVPRLRAFHTKFGNVEIKCPAIHTHSMYQDGCLKEGRLPPEYVKQVQGQMWVTGRHWCDFISFHPEAFEPLTVIRVERDVALINQIQTAVYAFIDELDALIEQKRNA